MNTGFHKSLSARLFSLITKAATVAALFLAPVASQAQFADTATGLGTLLDDMGYANTADGYYALCRNTTGYSNTGIGDSALFNNTTGTNNTGIGSCALSYNTTGNNNTATGEGTLACNTTGGDNTAIGYTALLYNTQGYFNTATGYESLYNNTLGCYNTTTGTNALYSNTTGSYNTAAGLGALYNNTTGAANTALGYYAGYNITTGIYNVDICNQGLAADSGVIRIGTPSVQTATYIAGISGQTATNGVEVFINANGQLGTIKSSRRFKNDINDMGEVSDKLMQLRPVTFRYKDSAEKGPHALQYGLIAEEVARVYPDLVQYDANGKPFTVFYHLLTPMLLNEFQKEHRRNEAQTTEIAALKTALQNQNAELAALKQAQQQQLKVLAKLAAYVQTAQTREPLQKAVCVQRP